MYFKTVSLVLFITDMWHEAVWFIIFLYFLQAELHQSVEMLLPYYSNQVISVCAGDLHRSKDTKQDFNIQLRYVAHDKKSQTFSMHVV